MAMTLSRKQFLQGVVLAGAAGGLSGFAAQAADVPAAGKPAADKASLPPVTAAAADFVVGAKWSDLPPDLVAIGKLHILDALGLALTGERAETAPVVLKYLKSLGVIAGKNAAGKATVLGTGLKAAAPFAAFANGIAMHADDFDDTQLAVAKDRVYGLLTHPTVTALAASLAASESRGVSGRDFMVSYHLGVEVSTKVCEAIGPRSYQSGFHSTSMCGVFGAAAAAGKVYGLDASGIRKALGLAGAGASGLRENFGTMTKPFQAGHAAEGGVEAAEMTALGWTAAENILEAKRGFFAAFGDGYDPASILGKLGNPWTLVSPGVSIKPYPSGSLTHPAMDELLALIHDNRITADQVSAVKVGTNKHMLNTLIHHDPRTGLQGKFSMEYCMATLVLDGHAGLRQFTDEQVNRPAVREMMKRVTFYNNPEADSVGADKMHSIVEIELKDGRTFTGRADFAKGGPKKPFTFADSVEKFEGCAEYARLPKSRTQAVVAQVRDLEDLKDIRALVANLARS